MLSTIYKHPTTQSIKTDAFIHFFTTLLDAIFFTCRLRKSLRKIKYKQSENLALKLLSFPVNFHHCLHMETNTEN